MRFRFDIASIIMLLVASIPVNANEFHAETFVNQKCAGCHDSSVYTRTNRRVKSLPGLRNQVKMCDAQLGIKLFDEDLEAVVEHLNSNYYHFEK